ncbi:MAG: MBL fold metallo-hydrolase [Deltaproteobacteria bacterium]|nr:MBL fold metallo-hydrolase [Deltaproteobacteria bacterium]
MIRICVLASGSKGNSVFIESERTSILIDAGLSGKEIRQRLLCIGAHPGQLSALIVTHEHADHVKGVGVLSRQHELPVYITEPTYHAASSMLKQVEHVHFFRDGVSFKVGDLTIRPYASSHDAVDPVNFTVSNGNVKLGLATDLGFASALTRNCLRNCHALILETNHDREMLRLGPYPEPLKQRILSRLGHLSNDQAAELLADLDHLDLRHVFLAHLSEANNLADKAVSAVGGVLKAKSTKTAIHVCSQDRPSTEAYI